MKYSITDLLTGVSLERADRAAKVQDELDELTTAHEASLDAAADARGALVDLLEEISMAVRNGAAPYDAIYRDTAATISHDLGTITGKLHSKYDAERNQYKIDALQKRLDAIHAEHGEVGSPLECFLDAFHFSGETQVSASVLTAHGFDVKRVPLYLRAAAQSRVSGSDA